MKLKLRHDVIVGTVICSILKCILRYLLMAAYLYACNELGLYNYGWITKVVITLTSLCISRWILREIGRAVYGLGVDDPPFQDIGIVACVRDILSVIDRW